MNRGCNPITQLIGDSPDTFNDRTRLTKPATTIVLSLLSATALLALAGWFIASSAVAGLAVASTFSFLFPSAGVQALAWARTLARYGERITTHRATLELAATRVRTCLPGAAPQPRSGRRTALERPSRPDHVRFRRRRESAPAQLVPAARRGGGHHRGGGSRSSP